MSTHEFFQFQCTPEVPERPDSFEFAEIDLKAARTLLKEGSLPSVVCFHAQQCVEKSLKALIESKGVNPPKSHDLIMLYGHVGEMVKLEEDTLAKMNQVYKEI